MLEEGDKLYLNALANGKIPDAETVSLNCLPDRIYWPFSKGLGNEVSERNFASVTSQVATKINEPIAIMGTNTEPLMLVEAQSQSNNINSWWLINNYKEFYQGRIACSEHENEAPYVTLHSALVNTFSDNNYAFIILDGYIMALIKSLDSIYEFDCVGTH